MFRFKQFNVDQTGCAMKINTDGVLLGAMAQAKNPGTILDIGTGTGVIAMMLAQRFTEANIDAVEIDVSAAKTAGANFNNSVFYERIHIFPTSIGDFLDEHLDTKYDLIISNPPFFINSLESPKAKKTLAKHTDANFFEMLMKDVAEYLSEKGVCWLVLPIVTSALIKQLAKQNGLHLQKTISVHSFEYSEPHREMVCFGFEDILAENNKYVIYQSKDVYSDEYQALLQPYFLAF
jgi:tRNA1Val (adenine37-N6)-methyltransferase